MASLFEQLGGVAAVNAAIDIFYKKVLADPLLEPFFQAVDMDVQAKKLGNFLTMAFGGPNHYTGKSLRDGHQHLVEMGMGDAHFDRVIQHLGSTLQELGVPQELIAQVAAIGESTRNDVLNR
jgi:hemoglobin